MKKIVVLTGAGISAESGLKTFRDGDGLWENYRVEDVATIDAWHKDSSLVLRFYNERRKSALDAEPNQAHLLLAELQNHFDVQIITQNIDDLHERAGSKNVLHLHGEITKMRSVKTDRKLYSYSNPIKMGDLAEDGGQLRPFIVWFGEPVPMMVPAIDIVESADIFIVVGTSLQVYPAAGLLTYVKPEIPKYIIDRRIPDVSYDPTIVSIEKNASEGVKELVEELLSK